MEIPEVVKKAANSWLQNIPGSSLGYLGEYKGRSAFYVDHDLHIGYPTVFLFKEGDVIEKNGEDALSIISSLL